MSGTLLETSASRTMLPLGLAAAAGFVDAFGYVTLGNVMVAHMSGNTAAGAAFFAQGALHEGLQRLILIPAFAVGTGVGAVLSLAMKRRGAQRPLRTVLALELAVLGVFLALDIAAPSARAYTVALLAVAMGIQNATARHVGGHDVRTTFVTGMIVAAVDEVVQRWFDPERESRGATLHAAVWVAFFVGASLGAVASLRLGSLVLLAPMIVLFAFAAVDAGVHDDE